MSDHEWSPQQQAALKVVSEWVRDPNGSQVFRLFGFAGTGKTTLARHIADDLDGDVVFAAFTGKAASVMRSKGCADATTIHSLIYHPRERPDGTITFRLNYDSAAVYASLVIIDECSMVGKDLGEDLLSLASRVLVIGDPAQLPPVDSLGFFTKDTPDVLLTEIHRQALDNPIIKLSLDVREKRPVKSSSDDLRVRVIDRSKLDRDTVLGADIILTGTNRTRVSYNQKVRQLRGIVDPFPLPGERLVCLRNKHDDGLLNGTLWRVTKRLDVAVRDIVMMVEPDEGGHELKVAVNKAFFLGTEKSIPIGDLKNSHQMTFGYALTVHKAQGSQWSNVLLRDESYVFREDWARHLYTGITRASEKITIVRNL